MTTKTFTRLLLPALLLLLTSGITKGQGTQAYIANRIDSIRVDISGSYIENPWAGGLNYCQISEIDLNMDGTMDLFVFDRTGNRITTYVHDGTPNQSNYTYAPEYIDNFPEGLTNWVLLRDYNCDGKMDIFAHISGGIKVYKNTSTSSTLSFQLENPFLYTQLPSNYPNDSTNTYVSASDIPAIDDIDGDGDLDILTFYILGSKVEYHKNLSVENSGNCGLYYELKNACWGHFSEGFNFNNIQLYDTCASNVPSPERKGLFSDTKGNKHSGSTLMTLDVDSNGVSDLVLGDISFSNLVLLVNGGQAPNTNSSMKGIDTLFPKNYFSTIPVDMDIFPASFYLDADNDNVKDLIVSPNHSVNSEDFQSVWFYKNNGADNKPVFDPNPQKDFLQGEMIETGAGAFPVLHDHNNDSLLDLFIGNYGYYNSTTGKMDSKIAYFENTGTAVKPEFTLVTRDFANLSSYNLNTTTNQPTNNLYPAFGDLDGDGDDDMMVGDWNGKLHYFVNNSGSYALMQADYGGIDVGSYSTPQIIDLNRDSLLDLVIGDIDGNIHYYENTGTSTSPIFTLVTDSLGGIVTQEPWEYQGFAQPFVYEDSGSYKLISGSKHGRIFQYTDIDNNLNGNFTLSDSLFGQVDEGHKTSVYGGDLNNDGIMDLVIGNFSGGVALFYGKYDTITSHAKHENKLDDVLSFNIYPVPANEAVNIVLSGNHQKAVQLSFYNAVGMLVKEETFHRQTRISTKDLKQGIYFVEVKSRERGIRNIKKLVIQH